MKEINIYLDESGKLSDVYNKNDKRPERFFIIGGFVAEKTNKISRHFLRSELKIRKDYNIDKKFEIKAADSNPDITARLLNSLTDNVYPV
ncbi:hypothetical protein SCHIN_v1c07890 [Spiroplasma chinense]|uniref:DUF3800 domain-containing protein n=1 Tax=Spiroplasma chinense TaxID=216932 RepID=A0A5B9Y4H5_9MOLU|nr:DUF3800 domain-containing protein [Spiroplasma chinense]QEH61984.1 hypothetical protein SCHIN_v1c07890 [Spiroplasma chinense]